MTANVGRSIIRSARLPSARGEKIQLPPLLGDEENYDKWLMRISDPDSQIVLDLFSGAGGMSHGFEREGFVVGAGLDIDAYACETFAANHLGHAIQIDLASREGKYDPIELLQSLAIPRVDVIVGGPPCQGFSQIGVAKVKSLSSDVRDRIYAKNFLYREFIRFVEALQPKVVVIENVPHLSNFGDGLVAREIESDFFKAGYRMTNGPLLLDATHFGVPQMRKRLFFIGIRSDLKSSFLPPTPTHGPDKERFRTLADAIAELPKVEAPSLIEMIDYAPRNREDLAEKSWSLDYAREMRKGMPQGSEGVLFDHIVRNVRDDDKEIFRSMRQGGKYDEVAEEYRRYEMRRNNQGDAHFSDRYFRLPWNKPSITITAHLSKDGYRYIYPDNDQIRTLSVREAARIQSFPDHFRFAGYRTNRFIQIGNAVPPLLAQAIAREVKATIRSHRLEEKRAQLDRVQQPLPLVDVEQQSHISVGVPG